MATLFKPTRPYALPADAEIADRDGKPHVRVKDRGKSIWYPLSEDKTQYLKPAAKWAADVRLANGNRKRVRFSPNRDAAAVMLSNLLKKIENEKAGIRDPFEAHRKRPLTNHLDDWKASLEASGRSDEYVTLKLTRVRAAFDGCAFVIPPDLSADRLETFLHKLRVEDGRSVQTANDWLQAVRQFVRWMISNGRMERDPFARLKAGNAKLDTRRRRGEFSPEEIGKLLAAAATSAVPFRGLTGPARRVLYRVALGTGFRAAELAALVPDYFDLDATTPAAVLPAEFTKNRKGAVQPIPADLADELRGYLRGRPRKERIWPGTWCDRSADMLKLDLDAAGVPVKVDGSEGEEVRDFHALRNCYISNVLRTGADMKQAMTLARHSDPRLTAGRYARTRLFDLGALVNKLPTPTDPATETAALRMTGTDSAGPVREQHRASSGAATGAATGGERQGRLSIVEESDTADDEGPETLKPLENQGLEGNRGLTKTIEAERTRRQLNFLSPG
jgi:integrase